MEKKTASRYAQALFFLFFFILFSYNNTLTSSWHFDDLQNIVENEKLHLTTLDADSILQVFLAHPRTEGKIFRPIAYLSFALNWYLGADSVIGYHLVNILLHWATACLLYLTIIQLLATPFLQTRSVGNNHFIALISALLWALNPIQTQAVTYIVQRMAGLATFFSLITIICYLLGRRSGETSKQFYYYLIGAACFILALGSKENSITLPASILLIEIIFFQSLSKISKRNIIIGVGMLCIAGIAAYLLTNGHLLESISGYDHRSFTLWQRLLTESRIMVLYLSLLLYPAPSRLSLDHDIALSTSLFQPPTTLLSIAFLATLTAWSLWKHKSLPIPAFAVLFFLLNHIVESTVFPLEIIFEHRNYLPSLFLFLPIAVLLVDTHTSDRLRSAPFARHTLVAATLLATGALAVSTFNRNAAWQTEQSLWEDSLAKAPGQSRPYINLAVIYQQQGKNSEAFELCRQSLTKNSQSPVKDRTLAYNNMGNISMDWGNYANAISYYRDALHVNENPHSRYFIHKALLANGQIDEAHNELTPLIYSNPDDYELMTSMAIILTAQKEYSQAGLLLRSIKDKTASNSYIHKSALICLGSVLSRQKDFTGAEQHFREALSHSDPKVPLLCIIGNYLLQGNNTAAVEQLKELAKYFSTESLLHIVQSANRQNIFFPVEAKELLEFIRFTLTVPSSATNGHTL